MSLTIRTNIPSIIAQGSLNKSTNALNESIKRMTTGLRINSSSDDAAGYSIINTLTTQLSSWDVAEDNVKMGIDLLNTANDTTSQMQAHGERLMALCIQARNGTYGNTSLSAIQSEANARVAEIARIYQSAEYNGVKLLDKVTDVLKAKGLDTVAQNAGTSGTVGLTSNITANKGHNGKFIDDIVEETPEVTVTDPTQLASAISTKTKIGIGNAETLAKLAELVNSGTSCSGKTIILTSNIDLSAYHSGTGWAPIGTSSNRFHGIFNGNGYVVSNLYINNPTESFQGLFGYTGEELKNIGIENCEVNGLDYVGILAGYAYKHITNCYTTGNVGGDRRVGGLAGDTDGKITNSYSTVDVSGNWCVGGLAGYTDNSTVTNSYARGNVSGNDFVGGLVGSASTTSTITNRKRKW